MRKVLCYSVWLTSKAPNQHKQKLYIPGLLNNLELAKIVFPDWEVWVYVGKTSIHKDVKDKIKSNCTKMIEFDDTLPFWGAGVRFLPAGDKSIDYFFPKDADASLCWKEKACVDEWIKSGKDWLNMRDSPNHCKWPMIAQLWGCKGGLIDFEKEVKEYYKKNNKWYWDQCFLRDIVWPIAKKDCLDFDSNKLKDWGTKMLDFPPHKESKEYPRVGMSIIRNNHL
jgi:hypothetical protein